MLKKYYYYMAIGAGSFFGGAFRYFFEQHFNSNSGTALPFGTLAVNILGSIIIGIAMAVFLKYANLPSLLKTFITTGFCGGFTTFSSFSYESIQLIQKHHVALAGGYIVLTMISGILGVLLGMWLVLRGRIGDYYAS